MSPVPRKFSLVFRLLRLFAGRENGRLLYQDFMSAFEAQRDVMGSVRAGFWLAGQLIISLCHIGRSNSMQQISQIAEYIKTAFRQFKTQPGYMILNILGLSLGMGMALLILLWVTEELRYDHFNENAANVYRVVDHEQYDDGFSYKHTSNAAPLAAELIDQYPEILTAARIGSRDNVTIKSEKELLMERRMLFTDEAFFHLFTARFIHGSPETALLHPNQIVLTASMARKYFGSTDVMGKELIVNSEVAYEVSGVIEDWPRHSHLNFTCLANFASLREFGVDLETWRRFSYSVYVEAIPGVDLALLNDKIKAHLKQHNPDSSISLYLQPLLAIHLEPETIYGFGGTGNRRHIQLFSLVAFFLLLAACINYMNLATARASRRAREVAVRKTMGASRAAIVQQFFGESMGFAAAAALMGLSLAMLALPFFNSMSNRSYAPANFTSPAFLGGMLAVILFAGLAAGSYPALYLSSFQPVKVLAGLTTRGRASARFRRMLVTGQFILTIALTIAAFTMRSQINFMQSQDLGYNPDSVLTLSLSGQLRSQAEAIRNRLEQLAEVETAALSSDLHDDLSTSITVNDWDGRQGNRKVDTYAFRTDASYADVMKLGMAEGRFFNRSFATDMESGLVINEALQKALGIEDVLGKTVMGLTVIGVVKDFHYTSLHQRIGPMMMMPLEGQVRHLSIRLRGLPDMAAADRIADAIHSVVPEVPLNLRFMADMIRENYNNDRRTARLIDVFTLMIVVIAGLGLLGLAAYTAESRAREISLRKVLGATPRPLMLMLSWDFVRWILLATLVAWPLSYILLSDWLHNFAYRTTLQPGLFMLATAANLVLSLTVVGFQIMKAVLRNPIEAIRAG